MYTPGFVEIIFEGVAPSAALRLQLEVAVCRHAQALHSTIVLRLGKKADQECEFFLNILSESTDLAGTDALITGMVARRNLLPRITYLLRHDLGRSRDRIFDALAEVVERVARQSKYVRPDMRFDAAVLIDSSLSDRMVRRELFKAPKLKQKREVARQETKNLDGLTDAMLTCDANSQFPAQSENAKNEQTAAKTGTRPVKPSGSSSESDNARPVLTLEAKYESLAYSQCPIFNRAQLHRMINSNSEKKSGHSSSTRLQQLLDSGYMRRLYHAPPLTEITSLRQQFPNFGEAVALIESAAALSRLGNSAFNFRPVLLLGPPGVGKTHFASTLAKMLRVEHRIVNLETATASWILSGSSPAWEGSDVGAIASGLIEFAAANFVMLADEVDKANGSRYNPTAALYSLLEVETARRFKDEYLGVELDASHINWLLTANREDDIPFPLLSRMNVISVAAPTPEEARLIALRIYKQLRAEAPWGDHFDPVPGEDLLHRLLELPPRRMRNSMLAAFGLAATRGRREVRADDVAVKSTSVSIGFMRTALSKDLSNPALIDLRNCDLPRA